MTITMTIKRERLHPLDVLTAMQFAPTVVAIAAADVARGIPLMTAERNKLFAIAAEFEDAIGMTGGGR